MRRLGHLALLPAMFLTFTQYDNSSDGPRTLVLDVEGAAIAPISKEMASYHPKAKTTIRVYGSDTYYVTTPFEDLMKKLSREDMRPTGEGAGTMR